MVFVRNEVHKSLVLYAPFSHLLSTKILVFLSTGVTKICYDLNSYRARPAIHSLPFHLHSCSSMTRQFPWFGPGAIAAIEPRGKPQASPWQRGCRHCCCGDERGKKNLDETRVRRLASPTYGVRFGGVCKSSFKLSVITLLALKTRAWIGRRPALPKENAGSILLKAAIFSPTQRLIEHAQNRAFKVQSSFYLRHTY